MDFQALCELADRELSVGLVDEKLFGRSLAEAKGVEAHARQIYWHLRANDLESVRRETRSDRHIDELRSRIEAQEKRMRWRKESNRWIWAFACFGGFIATLVFSWFALAALRKGREFYALAFLTFLSLVLTSVAYVASRYHTETE